MPPRDASGGFNETFRSEWEFHILTCGEFRGLFGQFKSVLDHA